MSIVGYNIFVYALILVTSPVLGIVWFAIWLFTGGPVLFRQKRVGKRGHVFTIYKFRTMEYGAERKQEALFRANESKGPTFKIYNDPRFTPIGKFLSHTGLDELPQLWNVLRGEMALMGPRPLPVDEAKKLKPWMQKRHIILPGIISPAIIAGKYHEDFEGWMRSDVNYATEKSIQTDVSLAYMSILFLSRLLWGELRKVTQV